MRRRFLYVALGVSVLVLLAALALSSSRIRDAIETPTWLAESTWWQVPRAVAVVAVADSPVCPATDVVAGLVQERRIYLETLELFENSRLVESDPGGPFLWETPEGRFWMPYENERQGLAVVLAEQRLNIYGTPEAHGVRPGDVVIDAGAHVGTFVREALGLGASLVVAIEINPRSLDCLRRNLEADIRAGRVLVVDKGVWDEAGTLTLHDDGVCSICTSVEEGEAPSDSPITVELTTIDAIVAESGLERVDFIKLDVENAEAKALRGAESTLRRFTPRLAVAVENAPDVADYVREIDSIVHAGSEAYRLRCGSSRYRREANVVLPDILYFSL